MNSGLLMHFDALSVAIVDFHVCVITVAARRKSIMQELSSVQTGLLFLAFFDNSGHGAAPSHA